MTIDWLALVLVYVITACVSFYATLLYRKASIKMKRTRMIRSVYYLLASMFFANIWFLVLVISRTYELDFYDSMTLSYVWSIPRLILLAALIYFVYASISPPDTTYKDFAKVHKKIHKKT